MTPPPLTGDSPEGGWSIKNDERIKYVGKLEVAKGEDQTLKARPRPPAHAAGHAAAASPPRGRRCR